MYLGDYPTSAVIDFKWNSQGLDGASITLATDGSLRIYKMNSATQRTSASGITFSEDFDTVTGVHHLRIDTGDNTDAGFYAAGNEYQVAVVGAVVDGITVNTTLASFSIERAGAALALVKAFTAGDPWLTALPGAYAAGTAGKIIGDRIAASVAGAVGSVAGSVGSVLGNVGGNVVGSVASVVGAVGSVTVVTDKTGYRLSVTGVGDLLTTALTESYAADGAAATLSQILYMLWSAVASEKSISGTTMTTKKLDGTTTAMTFTLNSATTPTTITRAT